MLWQIKKPILGQLLRLFSQLLPLLLRCLRKLFRAMSNYSLTWSCAHGNLVLEIPSKCARFQMEQDKFLTCVRGSLSVPEFLRYISKFLSVYKNMI